jgi:hypothetical protein
LQREQLEEATQVLVVFGGRLGSILVESGRLTIEEVEEHLARHLDVPAVPRDRIERPDPRALEVVPADLARSLALFPMWIEKRKLHLAMLDPLDVDRVDGVSFTTGLSVVPYVIAERRLVQLQEHYYDIRPDPRFTDHRILELAGHVQNRSHGRRADDAPGVRVAPPNEDEVAHQRDSLGIRPLEDGEELSEAMAPESPNGEASDIDLAGPGDATGPTAGMPRRQEPQVGPTLEPARSVAEVAALEGDLALLGGRDDVVAAALRIATYFARVAALFLVRDGMIQGVRAAGSVRTEWIDAIYLPITADGMLGRPATYGLAFHGRPAAEGIDAIAARALSGNAPAQVAVLPIGVQGRIVNLLYVDNGAHVLPATSLAALGALCDGVSAAYERLITEKRKVHCGSG